MKQALSIILCLLATWGALVLWNWAEVWAIKAQAPVWLFDGAAIILFITGAACSVWFNELCKEKHSRKTR